jgi:signal transduction histidine kinase/ligand-binding sensor domain-containing protein
MPLPYQPRPLFVSMSLSPHNHFPQLCLGVALVLTLAAVIARAQQLPLKYYTSADGLAYDYVSCVEQDSRGFLWVCTSFGLSRFDGARFVNYRDTEGLMSQVNDLLETRDHVYWVASNGGGVFRMDAPSSARIQRTPANDARSGGAADPGVVFTQYPVGDSLASMRVNVLYEDRFGRIWAGTDAGLFHLAPGEQKFKSFSLGYDEQAEKVMQVWCFLEEPNGQLWVANKFGLAVVLPDGRSLRYSLRPDAGRDVALALHRDGKGRIWVGHERGLFVFAPDATNSAENGMPWRTLKVGSGLTLPVAPGEARLFTQTEGLLHERIRGLAETPDGHIWAGTTGGLSEFDGARFRSYSVREGFRGTHVNVLRPARDGSLWVGTIGAGILRLTAGGVTTFTEIDGRGELRSLASFDDEQGNLYDVDGGGYVNRFDPALSRFVSVRPNLPEVVYSTGWNGTRQVLRARDGEWWIATARGLYRFPRVAQFEQLASATPRSHYTTRDGLAYDDTTRLFEDSRGDIWFSTFAPTRVAITRWARATETFHNYDDTSGLPAYNSASSFCEDREGRVWVGFREGGLARHDGGGRFTLLASSDGMTTAQIARIITAKDGSIWAATLAGVAHVAEPGANRPRVRMYTIADGLYTNQIFALAEDLNGLIYIAAGPLLDRLDPVTGRVEHFDRGDGLNGSMINATFRDRTGALWFSSDGGLMRFVPRAGARAQPPAIYLSGLRVKGQAIPVWGMGMRELPTLELSADQDEIQVDFFGLSYDLDEGVLTQYRLEGSGGDWSAPSLARTLTFARLAPGSYRLLVRAITPDGVVSPEPAVFAFRVLPPLWQRWWFIALTVLVFLSLGYALYRYRIAQLLRVERVRTRIATDLHDDIGSSLSRVAILSEVVKLQTDNTNSQSAPLLTEIAESARGLMDSMSDIVWAIDPRRDDLHNVVVRVRQFASDVLEARDIAWDFHIMPEIEKLKLDPEQRRHLYLIFKEGINNVVRHAAGVSTVALSIKVSAGQLLGEISDDGQGFEPKPSAEPQSNGRGGNGLPNMRARAEQLGGLLEIESSPGAGTRLKLRVPLK